MISIVIPTLNEEKVILKLLLQLSKEETEHEIIIADAGSIDQTLDIAEPYATVIECDKKGRGYQLNEGAKYASGDILWFLHADSIIQEGSLVTINKMIDKGYSGGCFSLYFYNQDSLFMKILGISSNIRAKFLHLIFGDQSFVVTRELFNISNGFKEIPIMEDWDFSKRIHKQGKIKVLKNKIGTSGRRFEEGGQLKTLLKMHRIKIKYLLGVSPEDLSKEYKEIR